jgi:hypothetical protein
MRPGRDRRRWTSLIVLWLLGAGVARAEEKLSPGVPTEGEVGRGEVRTFLVERVPAR